MLLVMIEDLVDFLHHLNLNIIIGRKSTFYIYSHIIPLLSYPRKRVSSAGGKCVGVMIQEV